MFKTWSMHNLVGHPASEIVFWIVLPIWGRDRADRVRNAVHDATLPEE